LLVYQVVVPDLVVECARFHGSMTLLRKRERLETSGVAVTIKAPPAPP
jgi:hypothetical protein